MACSIDKSGQCLADSTKSSVSRSSTFFISPLASCMRLPFLKYGGITAGGEDGEEVVIIGSVVTTGLVGGAGCLMLKRPGPDEGASSEYFLLGLAGKVLLLLLAL